MEKGKFTNDAYIPLGKLEQMDSNISLFVKKYRLNFTTIVTFENQYAKMIETPELVKKRYIKNVELASKLNIEADDNDFITEIAKRLVSKQDLPFEVPKDKYKIILKQFQDDGNDLTIITSWLINEIDNFIHDNTHMDLRRMIPELSKKDEKFIMAYNETTKFYSIEDYIKFVSCSYETARSSLERLAGLNLFKKDKQGKRFVFKPTIKLQNIMKGGMKWI
ncbi:hypothetical protein [Mycoplasma marinum]|nr:hypothetical protein [Mycoplasma marinum]